MELDAILREYLAEPRPSPSQAATVVLVVDHDVPTRALLRRELERTFAVLEAASPGAALELCASVPVSAVVASGNVGRELLAKLLVERPTCARILLVSPSGSDPGQIAHRTVTRPWRRGDVLVALLKQLAEQEGGAR